MTFILQMTCIATLACLQIYTTIALWMQLGLRALKKAGREQSMRRFVQDASTAMPALASEFKAVALKRFHFDPEMSVQPKQIQFYDFLTSEDNDT